MLGLGAVCRVLLLGALAVGVGAASSAPVAGGGGRPAAPGEILVGFRAGVPQAEQMSVLARAGAVKKRGFAKIRGALAKVEESRVEAVLKELQADPRVRYAERNYLLYATAVPNDPSFGLLWGLHNTGQSVNGSSGTADADIDAPEAWNVATGSPSVVVGVVDTGVDFSHPDLAAQRWTNPNDDCGDRVDDDGNGYVDDCRGWDWVNDDNDPFDDHYHGTHVAGTIGAVGNNGVGVAGASWTVRIMALKFLGASGSGTTADAVSAILYAADMGAHITNNSWGGGGFDQALLDAIEYADGKGSLFVAAAGNSALDTDSTPNYPSTYPAANVVAVAATDQHDARASFSNWGRRTVDLGAPGVNVYSTAPGGGYRYLNGTSMATPHVAGAAALLKARFPGASDVGLKALLLRSVDAKASLSGITASGGRLNAAAAVSCSDAPKVWIEAPAPGFTVSVGDTVPISVIGARCAEPTGVAVSVAVSVDGGPPTPVSLTPRGDGLYTGSYTAASPGSLAVTATAAVGAAVDSQAVTGSAVANYACQATSFSWAATDGSPLGLSGDDVSTSVSLPFPFQLYGQSFSTLWVSSNGFAALGSGAGTTIYANPPIPTAGAPDNVVAPFWDDLYLTNGGAVYTSATGSAPSRAFTVRWKDVPHYPTVGAATFELTLYEGSNRIRFQYLDTVFGSASYDGGASATAGVEDGSVGRQWSFNQPVLSNGTAVLCSPPSSSAPAITTASLPDGTTGAAYAQALQAVGGSGAYTWSLDGGALPPGLGLSSAGSVSGIPTTAGLYGFTVRVTDGVGASDTQALSIDVRAPLSVTTSGLPGATEGVSYSQALAASGGKTPYQWTLAAGSLPPGLSLGSSGTIAGTPTAAGTYPFSVLATDSGNPARTAERALSIAVAPAFVITSASPLPAGRVGDPYSVTLQTAGGAPPYAWSVGAGSLPPGLALGASTGTIAGTPTKRGNYSFTVRAAEGGGAVATKTLALKIQRR